jgi:hypothetical protein
MIFTKTDKKAILDLFQTGPISNKLDLNKSITIPLLHDEEILLVWKEDDYRSKYFPIYICTPKGKVKEFLAWASTYMKQMKPFTAFTRVIDIDEFNSLQHPINLSMAGNLTSL